MLFYGLQGGSGVQGIQGGNLHGLGDSDYDGSCEDTSSFSNCMTCCNTNFNSGIDPDGNADCTSGCTSQFPAQMATNSSGSGSSSGGYSSSSGGGSSSGQSTNNANSSGQPWYSSIFGAVAQGVTTGLTQKPGMPLPAPWYATPAGMGGIAVVLIGLAIFLAKKD
jgi:hypothetical protein